MWNRFLKDEKGFTGLEAAIVLVAFVVVAAVFSYVMLGAGFYTTQKSQEVVHTGVAQASSSLAPSGDVIVKGGDSTNVTNVTFYVTNTAGGTAVDLDKTIITYIDDDDFKTAEYNATNGFWSYETIIESGSNALNLVEKGEKYRIEIDLNATSLGLSTKPGVNEVVKLEVKPPEGAVLIIQRTMPASLAADNYYTVY
ncbi:flagellin [Methanosarcina sp. KYL-1]|uniref:archaellin/type IV pilin N-terminal domain-containing protein n=1 Tax=Methanosarcina sp. KYL-1 TaxID=2602068 RepID=UPI002100EA70|nr:archaellin/type IV pilin N-terminal domain-containing protein [Methanosarcina sp. KYL-1]MCQ1535942.1 flagellin [Methanosarcina sp. KYL-1]